jgi:hypothetical protein
MAKPYSEMQRSAIELGMVPGRHLTASKFFPRMGFLSFFFFFTTPVPERAGGFRHFSSFSPRSTLPTRAVFLTFPLFHHAPPHPCGRFSLLFLFFTTLDSSHAGGFPYFSSFSPRSTLPTRAVFAAFPLFHHTPPLPGGHPTPRYIRR